MTIFRLNFLLKVGQMKVCQNPSFISTIFRKLCLFVFLRASSLNSFAKVNFHSALVNCDRARQHFSRLFLFSHAINIFSFPCCYVIKELVHDLAVHLLSYGCTWEVWRALGKLELLSAIASSNSYASLVLSKLPACIHSSIDAR